MILKTPLKKLIELPIKITFICNIYVNERFDFSSQLLFFSYVKIF